MGQWVSGEDLRFEISKFRFQSSDFKAVLSSHFFRVILCLSVAGFSKAVFSHGWTRIGTDGGGLGWGTLIFVGEHRASLGNTNLH